jgi:hypothetical protein
MGGERPAHPHRSHPPGVTTVRAVRILSVVLAVVFLATAAAVTLLPLPAPAGGGTCGPGRSSESALAAFFDPVSIGAGPEPPASSGTRSQWEDFVSSCQSSTDTRMAVAGGVLAVALLTGLGLPPVMRRLLDGSAPPDWPLPPGWYPDPAHPHGPRWWDGSQWGVSRAPPP